MASHITSEITSTGNLEPESGVQWTTGLGSELSIAVGSVHVTTAWPRCGSVGCVTSDGQADISGGSSSEKISRSTSGMVLFQLFDLTLNVKGGQYEHPDTNFLNLLC